MLGCRSLTSKELYKRCTRQLSSKRRWTSALANMRTIAATLWLSSMQGIRLEQSKTELRRSGKLLISHSPENEGMNSQPLAFLLECRDQYLRNRSGQDEEHSEKHQGLSLARERKQFAFLGAIRFAKLFFITIMAYRQALCPEMVYTLHAFAARALSLIFRHMLRWKRSN